MKKKRFVDISAIIQVIGNIYKDVSILDNDQYKFYEEDFTEEFHKILFGSIYNLHVLGVTNVSAAAIEDYLAQRPKKLAVYEVNKGAEYLDKISEIASSATFKYYYDRMRKMTVLRSYDNIGVDLTDLYDPDNIIDVKKKQAQEDWLDNTPLEEIADTINRKIEDIKLKYVDNANEVSQNAGEGALELLERLREVPEVGYPMFGPLINAVTKGARLKKFYLRSAATGVGKTRSMIADACYIACDELYDIAEKKWVSNGTQEPVIYIATEQDIEEIQTMMIAFISGVNEERIIDNSYLEGEWERVKRAAKILTKTPLYVQQLPDFSLQDIENTIKRGIRDHEVRYIFFDYIHTSLKIMSEISSKAKVKGLREDNILFMISIRLKDLCNQYGVFIMSATQLNADYKDSETPDQNLLRGAKSIADKIDLGMILLEPTNKDREALVKILEATGYGMPEVKISVYKNRRGQYKNIYLWCKADRGICRIEPMFATTWNYELIDMKDYKINVKPAIDVSAF